MKEIAILLGAIPVIAIMIDFFLSRSLLGGRYRWFVAPGVILHEMAHTTACLLTGAKLHAVNLFDPKGGSVEHKRPKVPIFGQIIISLAPLVVGVAAIYVLSKFIGFRQVEFDVVNFSYQSILNHIIDLARSLDMESKKTLILVYLLLSITVTMNPSAQDLMNIAFTVGLLGLIGYGLYRYTSIRPDITPYIPDQLALVLSTVVILLILSLGLSIIIFAVSKIIKPI
ncbi:MAG: M50 family metallopeptidase [Patescibacteria group bacterium]